MEKCTINMEINEPEMIENRPADPKALKKTEAMIATQFLQHVTSEIVKNARKVPGHGSPAAPVGQTFISSNGILWIDIEKTLAAHNPFHLGVETVEDALLDHPGYATDGIVKIPGETDRFVIGVDLFAAGVRCWF